MHNGMYVMIENVKNSKLLALFGALEERDKDIVITIAESLVARNKRGLSDIKKEFSYEKDN